MQSDSQKALGSAAAASEVSGAGKAATIGEAQAEGEAKLREFLKESIIRNVL